jgi:uncharacterized membrane protein YphA (DoxX/SURF4 family)
MSKNAATNGLGRSRTIAIWSLRIVVGLVFLFVGITKVTGTGQTVDYFAAIGWGQWFRYLTGFLDIAGTALLFVPRWTCYGAIVLACSAGTATFISLTILRGNSTWGGPTMVLVPLIMTVLSAGLALLAAPGRISTA